VHTAAVSDTVEEMDLPTPHATSNGGRMTNNKKGMEMSTTSPLFDEWVQAFDGIHPLVDIGCAWGKNVFEAAKVLAKTRGPPAATAVRVMACDCDEAHLAYTRAHAPPDVATAFARVPDAPAVTASSILIGEVLHFVEGHAIDKTLAWAHDALVPGGVLCLTAGTPWAKFVPGASGMCPIQAVAQSLWEANQGKDWPGSQGVNHQELMAGASLFNMPNDQLPTYLHPIAAEDLSRACERAGFEVLLKREQIHPGWPPASANNGRENAQVVARKVVRA